MLRHGQARRGDRSTRYTRVLLRSGHPLATGLKREHREAERIEETDGFGGPLWIVAGDGKARAVRSVGGTGQLLYVMSQDAIERLDDVHALKVPLDELVRANLLRRW